MLKNLFLVGIGGGIGSMLRYITWHFFKTTSFPVPTLIVNIVGSFIIGIVIGISIKETGFSHDWKLFLATGICGGFTTFSALSIENLQMLLEGKFMLSLFYISVSIILGIIAAGLGYKLMNH